MSLTESIFGSNHNKPNNESKNEIKNNILYDLFDPKKRSKNSNNAKAATATTKDSTCTNSKTKECVEDSKSKKKKKKKKNVEDDPKEEEEDDEESESNSKSTDSSSSSSSKNSNNNNDTSGSEESDANEKDDEIEENEKDNDEQKQQKQDGKNEIKKEETKTLKEQQQQTTNNKPENEDEDALTIFVGNLPPNTTRKSLMILFRSCGPIHSTRIRSVPLPPGRGIKLPPDQAGNQKLVRKVCANTHMDETTLLRNSVQGYVKFQSIASIEIALQYNNTILPNDNNNYRIRVDRANQPFRDATRSVFVGNLPFLETNETSLRQHFVSSSSSSLSSSIQEDDIEGIRIIRDSQTYHCKGFAYVLFIHSRFVPLALDHIHGTEYMGRKIRVMICGKRFKTSSTTSTSTSTTTTATAKKRKRQLTDNNNNDNNNIPKQKKIMKLQQPQPIKQQRKRGETKKKMKLSSNKNGMSRRAMAESKAKKRIGKYRKRFEQGMGKQKKNKN